MALATGYPGTPPALRGAAERSLSHVVLVGAGKGGVGTSTVSALVALEAAAVGLEVLLVDMDDGASALPSFLGMGEQSVPEARPGTDAEDPADRVIPVTGALSFLPLGIPAGSDGGMAALRRVRLRRVGRLYEAFDLVVVDGGSRLSSVAAALDVGAGRVVAVATAERVSLAATHALFRAVSSRSPRLALEVAANRVDPETAQGIHGVLAAAAATFLRRSVALAAAIPPDPLLEGTLDPLPLPFLPRKSTALLAASMLVGRWMAEGGTNAQRKLPPG